MISSGTLIIDLVCTGIRTFNYKDGRVGQEFISVTPNGYTLRVQAPAVNELDLKSLCEVGKTYRFLVEPCTIFTYDIPKGGSPISKNVLSLRIKKLYKEG